MYTYMFGRKTRSNSFHGNENRLMITVALTPGYLQMVRIVVYWYECDLSVYDCQ